MNVFLVCTSSPTCAAESRAKIQWARMSWTPLAEQADCSWVKGGFAQLSTTRQTSARVRLHADEGCGNVLFCSLPSPKAWLIPCCRVASKRTRKLVFTGGGDSNVLFLWCSSLQLLMHTFMAGPSTPSVLFLTPACGPPLVWTRLLQRVVNSLKLMN